LSKRSDLISQVCQLAREGELSKEALNELFPNGIDPRGNELRLALALSLRKNRNKQGQIALVETPLIFKLYKPLEKPIYANLDLS